MNDTLNNHLALSVIGYIKLKYYHLTIDSNSPNILIEKGDIETILVNEKPLKEAKVSAVRRMFEYLVNEGVLKHISGNYFEDDYCCELVNYKMLDVIAERVKNNEY